MPRAILQQRAVTGGNYFAAPKTDIEFIGSGCKMLDLSLGGGWAEDHVINIVGDKSTGKTLLAIEASANFIRKYPKGKIRYRENERAFQTDYASALGMPMANVDLGVEPYDTVEDFYEELDYRCSHAKQHELFILDSLDALSSRAEQARKIDDNSYGGEKAKKMSEMFRRRIRQMADAHITLVIISQIRDNIGVKFGRSYVRTGGKALDFYASQVVYLAQVKQVRKTVNGIERAVGIHIRAKIDKNKIAQPFREAEFNLLFGWGLDDAKSCIDWLKDNGGIGSVLNGAKEPAFLNTVYNGAADLSKLHKAVERRWYEIENSFLPKRRKYE